MIRVSRFLEASHFFNAAAKHLTDLVQLQRYAAVLNRNSGSIGSVAVLRLVCKVGRALTVKVDSFRCEDLEFRSIDTILRESGELLKRA